MADIIRERETLQLVAEFRDGDDRTINLDNPKSNLTPAQINEVGSYAKEHNALVGDKDGADFLKFKSARKVTNRTIVFDLN